MKNSKISRMLHCIVKNVSTKNVYADGKDTGIIENLVITCYSPDGEFKILLEPKAGLVEKLQEAFSFGCMLEITDIFHIRDIAFSLYKDDVNFKIIAELKENIL
mgnify:FL=1